MNTYHKHPESWTSTDRPAGLDFSVDAVPSDRRYQDRPRSWTRWIFWLALLLPLVGAGIGTWWLFAEGPPPKAPAPGPAAEVKRKEVGKNVFLEIQGDKRRVVVKATVCLREGPLEGLLTRNNIKAHEYILSADVDARLIHATLIAAGAKPGSPVKFQPRYAPAEGTVIKITLQYQKDGKLVSVPAQQWIRTGKDKEVLEKDWVFAGSRLWTDPDDKEKPPFYQANHGDLICVCNMELAMLDLPIRSPTNPDDRFFQPFTERIPPLETAVDIILEPVPAKEKKKDADK